LFFFPAFPSGVLTPPPPPPLGHGTWGIYRHPPQQHGDQAPRRTSAGGLIFNRAPALLRRALCLSRVPRPKPRLSEKVGTPVRSGVWRSCILISTEAGPRWPIPEGQFRGELSAVKLLPSDMGYLHPRVAVHSHTAHQHRDKAPSPLAIATQ
jgi:hypothetical protein